MLPHELNQDILEKIFAIFRHAMKGAWNTPDVREVRAKLPFESWKFYVGTPEHWLSRLKISCNRLQQVKVEVELHDSAKFKEEYESMKQQFDEQLRIVLPEWCA